MNYDRLKELTEQGLSLYKIGKILDRGTTTIRYWIVKYGLKTKRTVKINNKLCLHCNTIINGRNIKSRKYCSKHCQQNFILNKAINENKYSARTAKRYLLLKDNSCNICKLKTWNNQKISLEIDHIDGCSINNKMENLRLLCPNCHSQTPTYKSKNKGKGRQKRRIRYQEGKSY